MRPSVIQLRQFYSSRLGLQVKKHLRHRLLQWWDEPSTDAVIGIGYAPPLLRVLDRTTTTTITALMPADQGAIYWPVHTDNRSILADELMPPFAENSIGRVLMLHALEFADKPEELLRVYWHMLIPGGRLVIVVPNRFGLWSYAGRTPFTRGRAFRLGRLKDMLEEAQFTLRDATSALYAPPTKHGLALSLSNMLEWLGHVLLPGLGGVIVIEAEKQIYAGLGIPVQPARRARWAPAAVPVTERR